MVLAGVMLVVIFAPRAHAAECERLTGWQVVEYFADPEAHGQRGFKKHGLPQETRMGCMIEAGLTKGMANGSRVRCERVDGVRR